VDIAKALGIDVKELVKQNQSRYKGLVGTSKLMEGTILIYSKVGTNADDDDDAYEDEEKEDMDVDLGGEEGWVAATGLPHGWKVRHYTVPSESAIGKEPRKYYMSPSGEKFRSLIQAQTFLGGCGGGSGASSESDGGDTDTDMDVGEGEGEGGSFATKSGFKGVRLTGSGKYEAGIYMGGSNRQSLGTFNVAEDAARAYDKALRRRDGANAKCNFAATMQSNRSIEDEEEEKEEEEEEEDGDAARAGAGAGASGYFGVSRHSNNNNTWTATHQMKYIGSFPKKVDATRAYDKAARACHGKEAKLNFPDENTDAPRPSVSDMALVGAQFDDEGTRWQVWGVRYEAAYDCIMAWYYDMDEYNTGTDSSADVTEEDCERSEIKEVTQT
jgi:hypothetical protein